MALSGSALFALTAAASWGGGDFSGGMGVKAAGGTPARALRFLMVSHALSLVPLGIVLLLWPEPMAHGAGLMWAVLAGVAGSLSLTAFYLALSRGAMGAAAAVSGLLAAAVPAVVGCVMDGAPGGLRLAGFALAGAAIWMIAAGPNPENSGGASSGTMTLAVLGGLGFGFYFVALKMGNSVGVFEPMAIARVVSIATSGVLLVGVGMMGRSSQLPPKPPSARDMGHPGSWLNGRAAMGWALGVALLDTGGNVLFLLATRVGRLDVASVLASLYPAGTILLAAWMLKERPTRRQGVGMLVAAAAVVMITV